MPGKHSTPPTIATILASDPKRLRDSFSDIQDRILALREATCIILDFVNLLESCKKDLLAADQLKLVDELPPWDGKDLLHPDDDDNKGLL